jgi:hypothetical protein
MALAALLPITTSVLGGVQAYRQSGGDIGATLLGAGLGAAGGAYLPAGIRMAGSALAANPAISGLMGKVSPEVLQNIYKGTQVAKLGGRSAINPATQALLGSKAAKAALGAGALTAGTLALPGLAGGAANLLSAPVRAITGGAGQVGQQGVGVLASGQPYVSNYGANLPAAVPGVDQYGNVTPSGLPAEVLGLPGLGRTLEAQRQGRVTGELLQRYGDIDLAFREAAARKDFERQAAMKGIGQNIATQAAMIQNAQMGAQNLGQTFGQGISNNIGRIYQYQ